MTYHEWTKKVKPVMPCSASDITFGGRCLNCGWVPSMTENDFITIGPEHVGRPWIKAFGQTWMTCDFMGRILPQDVGKRIYLRHGILQVENDEQRAKRLNKLVKVVNGVRVGEVLSEWGQRVTVVFDTEDGPIVRVYDRAELEEVDHE